MAMFYPFIVALHIILCVLLVLIIILQPGKGGDIGSAFGGGGAGSAFGPRGPTNVLQQATTAVAVLFMFTSISLAWFSSRDVLAGGSRDDLLEQLAAEQVEADGEATEREGLEGDDAALPEPSSEPVSEPVEMNEGDEAAAPAE